MELSFKKEFECSLSIRKKKVSPKIVFKLLGF
jgi:hypothetical protein